MADGYRVLSQKELTTGWVTAYSVKPSTMTSFASRKFPVTIISTIIVCNKASGSSRDYYIRVVPSGDSAGDQHIIFNQRALADNGTEIISLGVGLESEDSIDMKASGIDVSVSVFGIEMR